MLWNEDGIQEYAKHVSALLRDIRTVWLRPSSQACMSVLLQLTNTAMNTAASMTNPSKSLKVKVVLE